jgi:hypothetical protein
MPDPGAPNLILAGKAGDVGTGAADPPALHDRGTPPRLRHMPGEQLPAKSAAKDQNFNRFRFRHEHPPVDIRGRKGHENTGRQYPAMDWGATRDTRPSWLGAFRVNVLINDTVRQRFQGHCPASLAIFLRADHPIEGLQEATAHASAEALGPALKCRGDGGFPRDTTELVSGNGRRRA